MNTARRKTSRFETRWTIDYTDVFGAKLRGSCMAGGQLAVRCSVAEADTAFDHEEPAEVRFEKWAEADREAC